MFLPVFGVVAALTLSTPSPGPIRVRSSGATHHKPTHSAAILPANDLYAARARRRMASYLRMRLLELRIAGLRQAADAVKRHLPVDVLLPERAKH